MLYTYCKDSLTFKRINPRKLFKAAGASLLFLAITYYTTWNVAEKKGMIKSVSEMSYEQKILIVDEVSNNKFSKEAVVEELKRLNVKYPHIVLAQALIESGHFQSNIFRANNNLFGMKEAKQRTTTARGTNLGHAYYDNWQESILDYAIFQSAYLRDLKTEEQYLSYLGANYAEASNYELAVMNMVKNEKLKELFN
jgi:uncharacterized FlgJ-related protein